MCALEEQLEVLETTETEEKQKRQELTKEISEEIISLQLELDEKMAEREEMEAENGRLIAQVEQMSEQIALTEKQLVERTEIHQVCFYDYFLWLFHYENVHVFFVSGHTARRRAESNSLIHMIPAS